MRPWLRSSTNGHAIIRTEVVDTKGAVRPLFLFLSSVVILNLCTITQPSMKTVLLLNNAYWPSIGGVENSLRHLAQVGQERDWNVQLVVGDIGWNYASKIYASYELDGIPIFRYRMKPVPYGGPLNFFFSALAQVRLLKKLKRAHPDAVVISRFHLSTLVARYAGFRHVRYLVPGSAAMQYTAGMTMTQLVRNPLILLKRALHIALQKHALRKSAVYVFSNTMKQQCIDLLPDLSTSIRLTKPGVDSSRFCFNGDADVAATRENLVLPLNKKLVLFIGRFVPAKGVDVLIDAMTLLHSDVTLVLVGEGVSEPDYRKQISVRGLDGRVDIRKPTKDVESYYKACDAFAMTSNYEPLGQTILEAMASGLPVVAFSRRAGVLTATEELGVNEFIEYADNYRAIDLAECIKAQLESAGQQRQIQSQHVLREYSWSKLFDDLTA